MLRYVKHVLVPFVVLALAPAGLTAQQPGGIDPSQLPPEARELIAEMQQIQARLQPVQQVALQDPELQRAQEALSSQIQAAMGEADPATPERMERLQALVAEARTAQAEQDQARMAEVVAEAQQIEQGLQAAQAAALERPEIEPQVRGFQALVHEKMAEVDPEAERLIERLEELDSRLAALLGG